MVLFITGRCMRNCWYCPLSSERRGHDVVYANETQVVFPDEAVDAAKKMQAEGTGITGGEPMVCLDRVITYAGRLKQEFGENHHIHLYTGVAPGAAELEKLDGVVDEIRMHPPVEAWAGISRTPYRDAADLARGMGFSCGFEVPSLPEVAVLLPALEFLDFLTINELEWGEINAGEMRRRGLFPDDLAGNAVRRSRAWAAGISRHPKVYFCSSRDKDSVQLRRRLIRTAMTTARSFDEITRDGTVVYGLIEGTEQVPPVVIALGETMYEVRDGGIETAPWVLVEHGQALGGVRSIIERYPDRGIVVEVTPLP
jgi:pyruvate formate-lyase activating enzyme-like uncharacterized protein